MYICAIGNTTGSRGKDTTDAPKPAKPPAAEIVKREISVIHSEVMEKCARILERMTNLNLYDDIAKDFKYWDDPSDVCKEGEGACIAESRIGTLDMAK